MKKTFGESCAVNAPPFRERRERVSPQGGGEGSKGPTWRDCCVSPAVRIQKGRSWVGQPLRDEAKQRRLSQNQPHTRICCGQVHVRVSEGPQAGHASESWRGAGVDSVHGNSGGWVGPQQSEARSRSPGASGQQKEWQP